VPDAHADEAALVPGLHVVAVTCLRELVAVLRDEDREPFVLAAAPGCRPASPETDQPVVVPDLRDVRGQATARHALEVAAAGGHHLALLGSPGVGKTMLAERLPGLLPDLQEQEALEVTAVHSSPGGSGRTAGCRAPAVRRAPPHTTLVAMVGGAAARWRASDSCPWRTAACSCSTRRPSSTPWCSTRCASRWRAARSPCRARASR
jgi:magnesium chelatase family protein